MSVVGNQWGDGERARSWIGLLITLRVFVRFNGGRATTRAPLVMGKANGTASDSSGSAHEVAVLLATA